MTAVRSRLYGPRGGQTPAWKDAEAARGQQPKMRPDKAQREAIKRVQTAKKKAVGGKSNPEEDGGQEGSAATARLGAGHVPGHLPGPLHG
ncbi:hypothetical protein AB0C13_35935 [Streptomyces sp. NPDC049099]|uniref:hypothetical protein n=1 Tax=Streptomyces sp. NPDC049099 TaxID=3155768 RepID=UPI00343B0E34